MAGTGEVQGPLCSPHITMKHITTIDLALVGLWSQLEEYREGKFPLYPADLFCQWIFLELDCQITTSSKFALIYPQWLTGRKTPNYLLTYLFTTLEVPPSFISLCVSAHKNNITAAYLCSLSQRLWQSPLNRLRVKWGLDSSIISTWKQLWVDFKQLFTMYTLVYVFFVFLTVLMWAEMKASEFVIGNMHQINTLKIQKNTIGTKHNLYIFGVIPFIKLLKTTLKQQLNSQK